VLRAVEQHVITAHGWTAAAVAGQRDAIYFDLAARVRAAWGQHRAFDPGRRIQQLAMTRL
jgi:hypothetical protein